ncbi:PaaI family thioesterase [Bradyrhizobium sp. SK17]|jgi:uncharacterized protein (TIGR00369 family)|uniref:PaaI family thioesterase n=1 Tax=Bradyrhizobium sp. SK17 TaxID=2057741 RepID=UPI000C30DD57|nr:PaaI family thioesterase [Bradyrhizobium sp. SK17]AUC99653.1 PaaI family thioesterase [Bradyrhizobium sp. SK17]
MLDVDAFRRIVETAAFHQFIGLKLDRADDVAGLVVLRLPYSPALSIFPDAGVYHGGVIAALIDVAGAVACGLKTGRPTPTANFRVDFLKSPAKIDLIATGRLVRAGKALSVADVEISDDKGEVYAVGRGTFSTTASFKAISAGAASALTGNPPTARTEN